MIRHVVLFSAADPKDIDEIRQGLSILGDIPHSSHFEVSLNRKVDQFLNQADLVVYAEFEDEKALAAYKAHPLYAESIRRVKPLRKDRHAADFVAAS